MRATRIMSAIAAVAVAGALVACGDPSSGTARTRDLSGARAIASGYEDARSEGGVRMDGEVSVRIGGRDLTIPLDGAIDFERDATRFSISLAGLGLAGLGDASFDARIVDGRLYVDLGDLAGSVLGGEWAEIPLDAVGGAPMDPTGLLDALRGVTAVERVGTDAIRGVEATHLRGTVSLADAIERAPEARREALRRTLGSVDARIPVDVWVDGRDRPVRFVARFSTAGVDASVRLDLFDYGTDIRITAPPAEDLTSLGGLLGGVGTGPAANA